MSAYLPGDLLKGVVTRLADAPARGMVEFIVGKRALALSEDETAGTGTKDEPYAKAVEEMAACCPIDGADDDWAGQPYFAVIGANRSKEKSGFRTKKYPSNGPSNTIHNWNAQDGTPFILVPGTSPKRIRANPGSDATNLKAFLKTGTDAPRLSDVAYWWFRARDIEPLIQGDGSIAAQLSAAFRTECGLSDDEAAAAFDLSPVGGAEADPALVSEPASPREYLPDPGGATGFAPAPAGDAIGHLRQALEAAGLHYLPWQIAAYVAAIRTKPFVVLAGVSGTGKTRLAQVAAEATGSELTLVAVKPDWTDSGELVGYTGLDGAFREGSLLRAAAAAVADGEREHFFVLDEMNVARVEHYLAEVLSAIEQRKRSAEGIETPALAPGAPAADWASVAIPENLCIVGSVNMDETTHGFSRKVLDRCFVLEFFDIDLSWVRDSVVSSVPGEQWTSDDWRAGYISLSEVPPADRGPVDRVITVLTEMNAYLALAQLQVGYRTRDEVALFCINAERLQAHFVDEDGQAVDPLDVALNMKVLPRIQGSGGAIRRVLEGLARFAAPDEDAGAVGFPMTKARLDLMLERLDDSGFASYWL